MLEIVTGRCNLNSEDVLGGFVGGGSGGFSLGTWCWWYHPDDVLLCSCLRSTVLHRTHFASPAARSLPGASLVTLQRTRTNLAARDAAPNPASD